MRRPSPRIWLLAAVAVAIATAIVISVNALANTVAARRHYILSDCSHLAYRPLSIVLSCGNQPFTVTDVRWKDWNGPIAHGVGIAHITSCRSSYCPRRRGTFPVDLLALYGIWCPPGEPVYDGVILYTPGTRTPTKYYGAITAPTRIPGCGTLHWRRTEAPD